MWRITPCDSDMIFVEAVARQSATLPLRGCLDENVPLQLITHA